MDELCSLRGYGLRDPRMRMPQRAHCDSRAEVDELASLLGPDPTARSAIDRKIEAAIRGQDVMFVKAWEIGVHPPTISRIAALLE